MKGLILKQGFLEDHKPIILYVSTDKVRANNCQNLPIEVLIGILTACREITRALAFGIGSSHRKGIKFFYVFIMDFKDMQ